MEFKANCDITGTDKKLKYKQGDAISKTDAEAYLVRNPEYLEGLEYRSGKYHLPKTDKVTVVSTTTTTVEVKKDKKKK